MLTCPAHIKYILDLLSIKTYPVSFYGSFYGSFSNKEPKRKKLRCKTPFEVLKII